MLTRQRTGRKDETVALVTSLLADQLNAQQWLQTNRQAWGIENGLHQRLDTSLNDDRCRVRSTNGLLIFGMIRRIAVSLFMEWRSTQSHPHSKSVTDFQTAMGEDNLRPAMRFLTNKRPTLRMRRS